ncbi:hypothetical protein E2C01_074026 [Portunus trituberculatus]|uniref:Uncharacterized protein n=1 Tax=Portunus trituberculatus TaxID=210409 RepID=A0A5B7IC66_PORTR|nr:hypothetical protein [Portunus trituberculatus]
MGALEQAQRLFLAKTEPIASLQQQLVTRPAHRPTAPRLSTPEKCDIEMSTAAFTADEWQALMVKEALDAVSRIALQTTNQAADWCRFFTASQDHSEYFARLVECAADCDFKCPHCDSGLAEYMLLRKLVSGLESAVLKEEVFRQCDTFHDVDSLRKFCVAYEAAHRDAASSSGGKARQWRKRRRCQTHRRVRPRL